jgi:hypothetical protein
MSLLFTFNGGTVDLLTQRLPLRSLAWYLLSSKDSCGLPWPGCEQWLVKYSYSRRLSFEGDILFLRCPFGQWLGRPPASRQYCSYYQLFSLAVDALIHG